MKDLTVAMPRLYVWLWLIMVMVAYAFIAVHGAGDYAYNPDEITDTGPASGRDLREVLQFSLYESHPPFGNFLRHYWMKLSDAPSFVRCESLLFGLAAILLYYAIGRLMAGDMAGMCCALLLAASRGFIIQSFTARNYALFLLLLSACFYFFLSWRRDKSTFALAGYAFFGALAGATHFSALFAVFCMGSAETAAMLRQKVKPAQWAAWLAGNAFIAVVIGALYDLWLPTLRLLSVYFSAAHLEPGIRLQVMLLYPLGVMLYLSPRLAAAIPLTCAFIVLALWPGSVARRDAAFRFPLLLALLSVLFGMALFITDIYTPVGGRHNFWAFPFIVPVLGWLLADACRRLGRTRLRLAAILTLLPVAFFSLYSAKDRFSDGTEYAMTRQDQAGVQRFFSALGPRDLIVMERDDVLVFANIYPLLGDAPFTGSPHAALLTYGNTHILYDPFFRRIYSESILRGMFDEAQEKKMLDGIDRLVFFYSRWPHSIAAKLMLCPSLKKEVTTFPPSDAVTEDSVYKAGAALMTVSRQAFFDEVLQPSGIAHACISGAP